MFRKNYLTFLLTAIVFLVAGTAALAQTAPVRGEVKLKKSDGTTVPVAGALVEAYRTDIDRGKMPEAKTNKRGEFSFAGFPLGQRFVLVISGPGISPTVQADIKAGMENIVITATEGDGRRLTEAEARSTGKSASAAPSEMSAEEKKAQADLEAKNAEISARNKKIQDADAIASKSNTDGVAALNAKDWDTAIAKFAEGVAAVPDFVGSTPILLNGKLAAHKGKGYALYKEGAGLQDLAARKAKYDAANREYDLGLAAFDQAVAVLKGAAAATDPNDQKTRDSIKLVLYGNATEIHRLKAAGGVDTTKGDAAATVITDYIALETDPAKKLAAQLTLGDVMRDTGNFEKAVTAYKAVLEASPDNPDATAQLGLVLVALGTSVDPPNKEQLQEGLNYMQKFADTAPDTHKYKADVKQMVEYLKNEQKLTPQKVTQKAPPKKRT